MHSSPDMLLSKSNVASKFVHGLLMTTMENSFTKSTNNSVNRPRLQARISAI